jgi:Tfp pilus assembly protein PilN
MVNINLVPEKIRSAENLQVIVMIGALSLLLPVLYWGYRYQGKRAELASAKADLDALNAELSSPQLKQVVADVEQFTKDQAELDTKRSVVDQLRKRQVLLVKLLDLLPDIMPRESRVFTLKVTDVKAAKQVEMACEFRATDAVATVYENLEASPLVSALEMSNAMSTKVVGGRNVITATYKFMLQDTP